MKKTIFSVLISAVFILYAIALYRVISTKNNEMNSFQGLKERGELVVAIDENQPGYFMLDGFYYGFQYDILNEYCKANDLKLKVVPAISTSNSVSMLDDGTVDMACLIGSAIDENNLKTHILSSVFNSNFVVMTSKSHIKKSPYKTLTKDSLARISRGSSVVMTQNFTTTESYNFWLDSINHSAIISYDAPQKLIDELSKESIDYLVCNKTDALVGSLRDENVGIIHTFDEEVSSMLLVKVGSKELEESFNNWFEDFSTSDDFAALTALYHDDRFIGDLIAKGYIEPIDGISRYDAIIQQKSKELGFDWRLVSAIAYNESRFNPSVKSPRGAAGLMQIMPRIAKQFNVSADDIHDPSSNIEVALMLLNKIESSLRFPASISHKDKMSIILACYNGGIGHVLDARRLAVKFGYDPNKWVNVSKFLTSKNHAVFYEDEVVKSGKFMGVETISFVSNVWDKYDQYCRKIANRH
ncbi:MAG: transglycosylase SLT domain-containing protein [Rikenellaceae bacterium]